jgi:molybdopterin-guanine dinucleotide biosynthesis protein A
VLTGGASERMGRDKAAIEVDGVAMADRVAAALAAAGASAVVRVGGPAGDVADDHPGEGPLGGVLTALRWAAAEQVLVVAPCDLVSPAPAAFAALVDALGGSAAAVPDPDRPLPLALRPAALEPLAAAFGAGERSLRRALAAVAVVAAAVEPAAVADADTADELPPGAR